MGWRRDAVGAAAILLGIVMIAPMLRRRCSGIFRVALSLTGRRRLGSSEPHTRVAKPLR
jgi:hypothetical protein